MSRDIKFAGPLKIGHMVGGLMAVGSLFNRLKRTAIQPRRWGSGAPPVAEGAKLVSIQT